MIVDSLKQENMNALKSKDHNARAILSIVINKYMQMQIEARSNDGDVGDEQMIRILNKTIKELTDEAENYSKVGNATEVENIMRQQSVLQKYLPKMLSDDEILKIIASLEDNSLPFVMKHFKTNYASVVDMKKVGELLRRI